MGGMLSKLAAVGALDEPTGSDAQAGNTIYLWPECVEAWGHWNQLQTQWRVGVAGSTGLDYSGVRAYLDECGIEPGPERQELFSCIRACEVATLDAWAEQRSKEPPPTR